MRDVGQLMLMMRRRCVPMLALRTSVQLESPAHYGPYQHLLHGVAVVHKCHRKARDG